MYSSSLYELTHAQKRIWYEQLLLPSTSIYNIGGAVIIGGRVELAILKKAIQWAIRFSEGLRLRFVMVDGQVKQYVEAYRPEDLPTFHFGQSGSADQELEQFVSREAEKPFSLEDRLFYFALFTTGDGRSGYFVKLHHSIADGWSIDLLTRQIAEYYSRLVQQLPIDEAADNRYTEYVQLEQEYLQSSRALRDKTFWNDKLAQLPSPLPPKNFDRLEGKRKTFLMNDSLFSGVKQWALDMRVSINSLYMGLLAIHVNKTTFQTDMIIGSPALNRVGRREKRMFGMFTNTLPIRIRLDSEATAKVFIKRVHDELTSCYKHQKYPVDLLLQDLHFARNHGESRLFDRCVNYYRTRLKRDFDGMSVDNVEFYNGQQPYALQIIIREWGEGDTATIEYDYQQQSYHASDIESLHNQLTHLLEQIMEDPDKPVCKLSLLSKLEWNRLLEDSRHAKRASAPDTTVIQLFEAQAAATPDRKAVFLQEQSLTYSQLNEAANRLAAYLAKRNVAPQHLVGILTEHSMETLIAILAILKTGAAYVPLDTGLPRERIHTIVEDSGLSVMLVNEDRFLDATLNVQTVIDVRDQRLWSRESANNPFAAIDPSESVAYVIYTSGSTGKPKGVVINHQGLFNYIQWAKRMYVKQDIEVYPLFSSLAFDLTVTSIFTPLVSGGQIAVYPGSAQEHPLVTVLRDNYCTTIKLTPSHLSMIATHHDPNAKVRRFIVGGEQLKVSVARNIMHSFGSDTEIYNEYGPTEATVGCMIHKFDPERDDGVAVPIGLPIAETRIYILDPHLSPVPLGVTGEIYIAGRGLAKRYLNRPDLTAGAFIEHPELDERLYKTGDLAYAMPDGVVVYEGRADRMVKIRGYRVDLEEIEYHLLSNPYVREAVVVPIQGVRDAARLCAYIVAVSPWSASECRYDLSAKLPVYMIPDDYVQIAEIPLTRNGKVDIGQLPRPEMPLSPSSPVGGRNEKEKLLIRVIEETLGVANVGVHSHFFHLGGDSISAIQVSTRMKALGRSIAASDILKHPVIEEMSASVHEAAQVIEAREEVAGRLTKTPTILWFFSLTLSKPEYYHQTIVVDISPAISLQELNRCYNAMIRHHDALRLNLDDQGELYFNPLHLRREHRVDYLDLAAIAPSEQDERIADTAITRKGSTRLGSDLLIQAVLFALGERGQRLLLTAHHLVVDGVSWRILLDHLYLLLKQAQQGRPLALPPKTDSYKAWAEEMRVQSYSLPEAELDYWQEISRRPFRYPQALPETDLVHEPMSAYRELTEPVTISLLSDANRAYNTETRQILLLALVRAIRQMTNMAGIALELEGHGREAGGRLDVTETVGWFTSFYPLYVELNSEKLGEQLKQVKELVKGIPQEGRNYGRYKYICGAIHELERDIIRFNYLGEFSKAVDNEFFRLRLAETGPESSAANRFSSLFEVNALIVSDRLVLQALYDGARISAAHMEALLEALEHNIVALVEHCVAKDEPEFTSSDFELAGLSTAELDHLFK